MRGVSAVALPAYRISPMVQTTDTTATLAPDGDGIVVDKLQDNPTPPVAPGSPSAAPGGDPRSRLAAG